jgi:uncharacterized Zn finger protein
MNSIPTITEEGIREFVGSASFQRGLAYYQVDTIFNTRRQSMTLKAHCQGSRTDAYHVEVTFDNTHIISGNCSCPSGSYCKHIAALLLTWLHQPAEFLEQPEVDTVLEQYSKGDLIALIKTMLKREPDLEMLISPPGSQQAPINSDIIRRQVAAAFRNGGYAWGAEAEIADELFTIKGTGDDLLEQGDYANAIAIYGILVSETLEQSTQYQDDNGDLHTVISECIETLGECLPHVKDDQVLREQILYILFSAYSHDIEMGGIGIAEGAPDILLEHITDEERQKLVVWVHKALSEKNNSSGWAREQYGRFLLDLQANMLDDETFLRICRETGRTYELIDRLLQLGRLDEATREAQQVASYQLTGTADLFVQHSYGIVAEQIIRERIQKSQEISMHDTNLLEWLKKHYLARNEREAALELAQQLFHKYPHLAGYQEIRTIATQLDRWQTLRPQLLSSLSKPQQTSVLIQIALDEGDIDQALQLVQEEQQQPTNDYAYDHSAGFVSSSIILQVATAAEETRPIAAIRIYQQYAERLIAQRGRGSYMEACTYLTRMRNIYEKLGEHNLWTSYITGLRDANWSLRALKEELANAGL